MNQIKKILENEKRLLWFTFLVAFAIRLVYAMVYYSKYGTTLFSDDWDYINYAKEILNQGILVLDIDQIKYNGHQVGIGWPLILTPFIKVFGDNYVPIFVMNAAMSALQVVVLYKIAKLLFSKRVALFTILISILYIRFVKYVPFVLKENIIHLGFTSVVYFFLKSLKSTKNKDVFILAIVYLLFLHIDERYMVFGPVFVLIYLIFHWRQLKMALRKSAVLTTVIVIGVIPWTLRNNMVYKRPIILAFQTSEFTDFLFSNKDEFYDGEATIQKTPYSRSNLEVYEEVVRRLLADESVDEFSKDYKFISMLSECVENGHIPRTFGPLEGRLKEAGEFFRINRFGPGFTANGYRFYPKWHLLNNLVYLVSFGVPVVLMLLSLLFRSVRTNVFARILLGIMVAYSLLHVFLIHGLVRYRVPIDGFIFIFAAVSLSWLLAKFNDKKASISFS